MKELVFILIALLFSGCLEVNDPETSEEPPEPEIPPVELHTEKLVYQSNEFIELEVINPSEETVFLEYCGPDLIFTIYVKSDGDWTNYSSTVCKSIYTNEFVATIRPASSLVVHTQTLVPGEYRFELDYSFSTNGQTAETITAELNVR